MPKSCLLILLSLWLLFTFTPPFAIAQHQYDASQTSLINEFAQQNIDIPDLTFGQSFGPDQSAVAPSNNTYAGLQQFWHKDIITEFLSNVVQFIRNSLIAIIGYLCSIVKSFFLNTDLTEIKDSSQNSNDLSYLINQLANTISGISIDLLLLLFILSIWRYWTQSSWHGNGSPMTAIARLIFAMSTMIAWPKIYQFQIQLSNEMISVLLPDKTGQIEFIDLLISHLFSSPPSLSTHDLINSGTIPALGAVSTIAAESFKFSEIIASIGLVILCFLAIILIYELFYLIVLKAIQTALLTAQYVFAPFFLVFLSNPVTDNIGTSFLRSFVEVSLWNFIWIGLLKILIILLYSNFNPWGKIITAIGVLQLMMQVPQFLAHAKISVASDFVSPHFFAKLLKDVSGFDAKLKSGTETLKDFFGTNTPKSTPTKTHPTESSPQNFSFATNSHSLTTLPPTKPKPKESTPRSNSQPHTEPKTFFGLHGANIFAGAGAFAGTNTLSASATASGKGFAFASASSIANAMSIALAIINSSAGPSSNNNFPNNPFGPKPHPGPKPYPSGPQSPIPPNLGLKNSSPGPAPNPRPKLPPSGPHKPSISGLGLNNSRPDPKPHPGPKPYPCNPQSPNLLGLGPNNLSPGNSNLSPDSPSLGVISIPPPKKPLPPSGLALSSNSAIQSINLDLDLTKQNSLINPVQSTTNQSINCQIQKQLFCIYKRIPGSGANSYFYRSNKTYGSTESLSGSAIYNLIFNHGNSPTLMGIPPIYPSANRF